MQAHTKKNPFFLAYIIKNLYLCSVKSSFFGHIIIIVTIAILASCRCSNTTMSLHEAQEVVAHADSLWHKGKMYGVDEGDSATLAQAYERLKELSAFSRQKSEYAHACYHYGRLLREKDDPVAAMQAFIDATRSGTKDYHILGRVYSNIGDICHLAGDFQLSYDMFERSADMFLQNGDTLSYYYALNDMAFELAEQGKKDSCFFIANKLINLNNEDDILKSHCYVSQAQACLKTQEYDSVIYYVFLSHKMREESAAALLLAQSYSYMGIRDSAICYAELVLQEDPTLEELNNALYILTNDDETKDKQSVLKTAAERSDTQKLLSIRQGKLSQSVQLLEQDLDRKPDLRWLYAIFATVAIIACIIGAYVYRKRKKQELLTQKIEVLEKTANTIQEKKDELSERYLAEQRRIENEIKEKCELLRNDSKRANTLAWNDFDAMCRIIDRQFYMLASKLRNRHILNETETRLCILVLLELSRNEIAQTLPYALNGVGKLKDHTAKKLGTTGKNLHDFLLKLAVEK